MDTLRQWQRYCRKTFISEQRRGCLFCLLYFLERTGLGPLRLLRFTLKGSSAGGPWREPSQCLLRSAHRRGPVPATSPLKSLHVGTGRRVLSQEQFTRSVLCNKSQGLVPKIHTGLISWDLSQGSKLVPVTN